MGSPCYALLLMLVVHYTIVMPYVDGRVPNAMDEMRSGVQQLDLPCILPVQPASPNTDAPNYWCCTVK